MHKTIIFAHRGVSEFAPENTLPAFEMAMSMACPGIEFDLHQTQDGIPVILHDETIDRTSSGNGYVKDFRLAHLKKFDFGQKFSSTYTGTPLPSLEEFFHLAKTMKYTGIINLELKNDLVDYPGIEENVLKLLHDYAFHPQAILSSFNHESIARIHKLSPQTKVALLYDQQKRPSLKNLKEVTAISANIQYKDFSKELLEALHQEKIQLLCYTINKKEDLEKYIPLGLDGIFTNNPQLAMEILKNRATKHLE